MKGSLAHPVGDLVPAWLSIHCSSRQSTVPTCCLGYHPFIPSRLPLHSILSPEQILRVMVPPTVAFELGKEMKGDFGVRERS